MITGSHIPPDRIGLIFIQADGSYCSDEVSFQIEQEFESYKKDIDGIIQVKSIKDLDDLGSINTATDVYQVYEDSLSQIVDLELSWGLLFVIGIPICVFWSNRNNNEKYFIIPIANIVVIWMLGGLGLSITWCFAAGCAPGHGLTFVPLLSISSLKTMMFVFSGSWSVGVLTRK